MRAEEKSLLLLGAGLLAFAVFALNEPPPPRPADKPTERKPTATTPPPSSPPPKPPGPDDTDDETALARMLASETESYGARVVIGWMLIRTARTRRQSLYQRLTDGKGYGPRKLGGVSRYAASDKPPTAETRLLARRILSGELQPSAKIRALGHSPWVEDLTRTERSAAELLRNQTAPANFGGIWARLRGTRWFLYSAQKPPLSWQAGKAQEALDQVQAIDAIDTTAGLS